MQETKLITSEVVIKVWIFGSVVPKSRPRFNSGQAYLPERYRNWRQMAEAEIMTSMSLDDRAILPISKAEVRIILQGKHRGDPDNLAGSCLDALVASGTLADDRLSCVPRLLVEHSPAGQTGVSIEVVPLG